MKIETKVEYWKHKLLDLGKRNRMINCSKPKEGKRVSRTTLLLIEPSAEIIWNELQQHEQGIEFLSDFQLIMEDDNELQEDKIAMSTFSNGIRTNQKVQDACRTLINLKVKSKEFMDNKGMNALYLVFGFLNWKENGTKGKELRSPLLLMPVRITQESLSDSIFLSKNDEEPTFNNALQQKLWSDFNIRLPEYQEGQEVQDYLESVERVCSKMGWTVEFETVQLLMLSYLKMTMYYDIEEHEEEIKNNPIIRTLNGETDSIEYEYDSVSEVGTFQHDSVPPEEVYSVVDADSSQQDAIRLAKRGVSFVLQGPPGTGKSQTITNIIAELLGLGKKVLFVSEKIAALEVVYKRLQASGLGDFCLTLHNPDASRKSIMNQLKSSVRLSQDKAVLAQDAFEKLNELQLVRESLNAYTQQLHTKIMPLNISVFDANGELSKLESYPDIDYIQKDSDKFTMLQLQKNQKELKDFARIIAKSGYQENNPWKGCVVPAVNHLFRQRFLSQSQEVLLFLEQGQNICSDMNTMIYHMPFSGALQDVLNLLEILECAIKTPCIPFLWLSLNIQETTEKIQACQIQKIKKTEKQTFVAHIKEYGSEMIAHGMKLLEYAVENNLSLFKENKEYLNQAYSVYTENFPVGLTSPVRDIKFQIMLSAKEYLDNAENLQEEERRKNTLEQESQELSALYEQQKEQLVLCRQNSESATHLVTADYDEKILELDIQMLTRRFQQDYHSFFRFLNSQYRKDRKMLQSYSKINQKPSYKNALLLLNLIADAQEKQKILNKQQEQTNEALSRKEEKSREITESAETIREFRKFVSESIQSIKTNYDVFKQKITVFTTEQEEELSAVNEKFSELCEELTELLKISVDETTNFPDISKKMKWADDFVSVSTKYRIPSEFQKIVCAAKPSDCEKLNELYHQIQEWADSYYDSTSTFTDLFNQTKKQQFSEISLEELTEAVKNCRDNFSALEDFIDYQRAVHNIIEIGLKEFLLQVKMLKLKSEQIVPTYSKCFYRSWLDSATPNLEEICRFRTDRQLERIAQFRELDYSHLHIAQALLKSKLIENLPQLNFAEKGDEANLLKREMAKQRKLMPTRKLIAALPTLLPALKPCMLMSPLSVSTYFGNADYQFDTVIFDEASQIRTEEALCSILRAKQAIIAGDSKQLPPTDFFNSSFSDSDEYTEDEDGINDTGAFESLLDEASVLPTQTLLWHYRSKHEHLIAFSNYKIYQRNLITFPSAISKAPDVGVEYVYVKDGIYDRGGSGGNLKEAERIAELVFEHFIKHSDRSLGIIAFGEKQQNVIENALFRKRQEHPEFEQYFSDNLEEPLFIRNLETVQGDERDTIIFSIGYGFDTNGKFLMNFGPLSRNGGERRLNVAVTRARYNLKLVGSIMPTDIRTERTSALGPKLLREYIDFAIRGDIVLKGEINTDEDGIFDSPFEESVYSYLTSKGYRVATQVGCSGYRIDMAVYHPNYDGRFVIGIECDGAAYHSARTARERDRLRQSVLENMGWKIYRIWSTDWIKDTISEKSKLITAIEDVIDDYEEPMPETIPTLVKTSNDYLIMSKKSEREAEEEQYDLFRSVYAEQNSKDIPISDYEETLLKVLKSAYHGNSSIDSLFRKTAKYGYLWKRLGKTIESRFMQALSELEHKGIVEIKDLQVKIIS